jgi:SNF2 family DNA or RNA helicase
MDRLLPFQDYGAKWLPLRKCRLLADQMGLGKTPQIITAADIVGAEKVLVVCPAVAKVNWLREFERWSWWGREFCYRKKGKFPTNPTAPSRIESYDGVIQAAKGGVFWQAKEEWDLLILDESHFTKSMDAKRTKAIFGKNGLVRRAKRVWAVTGTPMPSHPGELWTIMYTFGATRLRYIPFIMRYCEFAPGCGPSSGQMQIKGAKRERLPELRRLLKPIMLRRRMEDVMPELPPYIFSDVVVEPGEVDLRLVGSFATRMYPVDLSDEIYSEVARQEEEAEKVFPDMKALEAMAGSISTLRLFVGLQKIKPVAELISDELRRNEYQKIVIFAIHRDVIEGLRRELKDFDCVTLYGKTPPERRQRNIDRFKKKKSCRVFIGNIHAAGTNLTLTEADQVLFVEQAWTPGDNAQAAARCRRIGTTRPVNVRFVSIADSIDEKISAILRRKAKDISEIFDKKDVDGLA